MKIFKYPLEVTDKQVLMLPRDAKVLSVQSQDGVLCLWAAVDPDATPEPYQVAVVGTGQDVSRLMLHLHIGTVQQDAFVWHVFGRSRPSLTA